MVVGGYFTVRKLKEKSPGIIAKFIEISAETIFVQFELPDAERQAAMNSIRLFTQDIRDGKVTFKQGKKVAQALNDKSLMGSILVRSFELKYINTSSLTDDEKVSAHIILTRFVHGSIENKISMEKLNSILDMISEDIWDGSKNSKRRLKSSITIDELKNLLKAMKVAADESKIENREFRIDIAKIIQDAIKKGMTENKNVRHVPKDSLFTTKENVNVQMPSFA